MYLFLFLQGKGWVSPENLYRKFPYTGNFRHKKKHFQLFSAKSAIYPIKSTFSDISTTTSSIPTLTGISFFNSFSSTFSAFGVNTKWSKNSVKSRISRYLPSLATRQPPHAPSPETCPHSTFSQPGTPYQGTLPNPAQGLSACTKYRSAAPLRKQ